MLCISIVEQLYLLRAALAEGEALEDSLDDDESGGKGGGKSDS